MHAFHSCCICTSTDHTNPDMWNLFILSIFMSGFHHWSSVTVYVCVWELEQERDKNKGCMHVCIIESDEFCPKRFLINHSCTKWVGKWSRLLYIMTESEREKDRVGGREQNLSKSSAWLISSELLLLSFLILICSSPLWSLIWANYVCYVQQPACRGGEEWPI